MTLTLEVRSGSNRRRACFFQHAFVFRCIAVVIRMHRWRAETAFTSRGLGVFNACYCFLQTCVLFRVRSFACRPPSFAPRFLRFRLNCVAVLRCWKVGQEDGGGSANYSYSVAMQLGLEMLGKV